MEHVNQLRHALNVVDPALLTVGDRLALLNLAERAHIENETKLASRPGA